jgi:hypothetical protein
LANIDQNLPVAAVVSGDDRSYVDWPAIFAGAVLATAISFVLITFGSAIGLSMSSAEPGSGVSLSWLAIVAGLWLLWVQIASFLAGGYLTGRLRRRHGDATEHESDIRDGSHGLVMWALGLLVGALIAFWGIGGTLSAITGAAGAAGQGIGAAAGQVVAELDPNQLLVDRTLRAGPNATGQVGEETRGEVGRILISAVTEGGLDDGDRQYLVSIVSARAGIPPEEAEQRIDQIVAQAQALEDDAREIAETTRRIGMVAAFMAAASLLVSGVAAYFGATLGGKHRDQQTVFADWSRPW